MGNYQSKTHPANIKDTKKFGLGIIDVQNDFCQGGSLAVKDADHVIAPINKLRFLYCDCVPTFISQDYHCATHMSFAKTHNKQPFAVIDWDVKIQNTHHKKKQTLWPTHCVAGTNGALLHEDLIVTPMDKFIQKGTQENVESYSAFGDEYGGALERTDLEVWLKRNKITDIILTGIATDYCVLHTALDAVCLGFKVHLILSCTKAVAKETRVEALDAMMNKGVLFYNNVDEFDFRWKNDILR